MAVLDGETADHAGLDDVFAAVRIDDLAEGVEDLFFRDPRHRWTLLLFRLRLSKACKF